MANKIMTVFQHLDKAISGNWDMVKQPTSHVNSYNMTNSPSNVIYKTDNKQEYEKTKLELQQNAYLNQRWTKANIDLTVQAFNGLNNVKLMYRDAELMDSFPEIGAALDITAEEATYGGAKNSVVNVYSSSDRIKNVLEDLFNNRLDMAVTAPMIIRAMCKYGNQFMLLNIDNKVGITGWRQLPVFNVERLENGIVNPYSNRIVNVGINGADETDMSTKFVWTDETNTQIPFRNWQIGHFRLLTNSLYLPYGVSYLNNARRHWRMLSLMEDMMLIYRLERSVERRVYKIYVGAIDDADVKAYVEDIANNFKRTPIIDPMTGQVDLRKNILPVHKNTPIPLLDGRTITIEELAKEYQQGKENYVYSIQDKTLQIVPGKVVWCGKNYHADELVKITLDDDTYCIMAKEHEVIMRDGSKKRADMLSVGESVMPLYRKTNLIAKHFKNDYEQVYNPNSGKYQFTHRLVGVCLNKKEGDNVIHHKDFNRFNNSPVNLQWMGWEEHRDYHASLNSTERVRELRSISSKERWNKEGYRENSSKHMTVRFDDYVWEQIDNAVINGEIYSQKMMIDFINDNLIDYLLTINSSRKLQHYKKVSKPLVKARIVEHGYNNINDYLSYMEERYNLTSHFDKLSVDKSERCKKYNLIENIGERWENTSRRDEIVNKISEGNKEYFKNNPKPHLDLSEDFWNVIRTAIINREINGFNELLKFISDNKDNYEILNKTNRTKVTESFLRHLMLKKGFHGVSDYIEKIRKNHKIKAIELISGDDVYCMTVQGLNGEEDRHNFAIQTWNEDGSICNNGIFVSNCADQDIFIPVRDANMPTPIDTLSAGQNLTAMDDIKFVQNKVFTALRIPKTFLNFEQEVGDGKNLSLMDVRFMRTINRIQQAFLMELTKIASIHLYLLGFEDELTNFSLSMNNPSSQAEQLEIDTVQKKISAIRDAVADPGNGIPIMSLTRALKEIMKWSDKDIQDNLEEIRLEKGIAAELEKTGQIIKKTGIFDTVDRIYGEPGAEYQDDQQGGGGQDDMMGGAAGGGGGGDFGGGLDDLGAPGGEEEGEIPGQEGEMPLGGEGAEGGAPPAEGGGNEGQPPMEAKISKKPLITESASLIQPSIIDNKTFFNEYLKRLGKPKNETVLERAEVYDKALLINEEFDKMINSLGDFFENNEEEQK